MWGLQVPLVALIHVFRLLILQIPCHTHTLLYIVNITDDG